MNSATTSSQTQFTNEMRQLHSKYIKNLDSAMAKETFEYWASEHLRVSGAYWALAAMDVMNVMAEMPKQDIVEWLVKCQHKTGGFGGNIDHDQHLLYTLSAVQILAMFDALQRVDTDAAARFVASLQRADGSFAGDEWGEIDTRFSYCAISCLSILGKLSLINVDKAVEFINKCKNFDGAFGSIPNAESHAGQTFCCVGALAIVDRLDIVDVDLLGWWLAERQTSDGGLNGRPEKLPDVCYSWWVLSSLSIIDRLHWLDQNALVQFILQCQDDVGGGFADRPGDVADVYHTFFALCGLSFMGVNGLAKIDPAYAMTARTVARLGLRAPWSRSDNNKQ